MRRPGVLATMALAAALLAGCVPGVQDLRQWVADERRRVVPVVMALKEPGVYVPQAYVESAAMDPFSPQRLTLALRRASAAASPGAALIASELNRRRQPLEAFPLDVMAMVGSMDRAGHRVALVKVDKLLYQVRPGDYLGLNYGLVKRISENEVSLREIVQDPVGEWVERSAVLQLQENTK